MSNFMVLCEHASAVNTAGITTKIRFIWLYKFE